MCFTCVLVPSVEPVASEVNLLKVGDGILPRSYNHSLSEILARQAVAIPLAQDELLRVTRTQEHDE